MGNSKSKILNPNKVFIIIFLVGIFSFGFWIYFPGPTSAAMLTDVRVASYPQKIRIVFDLEGESYYGVTQAESGLTIALLSCEAAPEAAGMTKVADWVVREVRVAKGQGNLFITIPFEYPVKYEVFPLSDPSRLVVDFGRSFTKIEQGSKLAEGLEYFGVVKGVEEGYMVAEILKVDPKKINIFPCLATSSPTLLESVGEFLNPWAKKRVPHFFRDKVSGIAEAGQAVAAINGTYFSYSGRPLGVLMIDKELVSYPISDRTALIITDNNRAFIDNVALNAYAVIGGCRYDITGINEPRSSGGDLIVYTKYYGELTETPGNGYEMTAINGKVVEVRIGNSRIPEDGMVLSAGALYAENLLTTVKRGDPIEVSIEVIPYSSSVNGTLKHLVGGGPRLLKSGMIYITKYEEKFRRDIARGRAARTAVGILEDGRLLFVTVDGKPRKKIKKNEGYSLGMTLTELAYFMQSLGVKDALNLDGGGSTTMVVRGAMLNRPTEGKQRPVGNAVLFK